MVQDSGTKTGLHYWLVVNILREQLPVRYADRLTAPKIQSWVQQKFLLV